MEEGWGERSQVDWEETGEDILKERREWRDKRETCRGEERRDQARHNCPYKIPHPSQWKCRLSVAITSVAAPDVVGSGSLLDT